MKSLIISTLMLGLALSAQAETTVQKAAQTKKTVKSTAAVKAVKKNVKADTKKAAQNKSTAKEASQAVNTQAAAAPQAAPAANTTSIPAAQATAQAKPKKFGAQIYQWNEAQRQQERTATVGDVSTTTRLALSYKIKPDVSVAVREEIDHTYGANRAGQNSVTFNDTYVQVAKTGIGVGSSSKLNLVARYYAPTSEASINDASLGNLRLIAAMDSQITKKFSTSLIIQPRSWFQQYTDRRVFDSDSQTASYQATKAFRMQYIAGASFALTEKLSLKQELGIFQTWNNSTDNTAARGSGYRQDLLYALTGAELSLTDSFTLAAGITQDSVDLRSSKATAYNNAGVIPVYQDDFAKYFLEATLNF